MECKNIDVNHVGFIGNPPMFIMLVRKKYKSSFQE